MIYKFTELNWKQAKNHLRHFPFHGRSSVYLAHGDVIAFNTGNLEMRDVRFVADRWHRILGHKVTVTLTDSDGKEYNCKNGMFMTRNNKDPHTGWRAWGRPHHDQLPFNTDVTVTVRGADRIKLHYIGAELVK